MRDYLPESNLGRPTLSKRPHSNSLFYIVSLCGEAFVVNIPVQISSVKFRRIIHFRVIQFIPGVAVDNDRSI